MNAENAENACRSTGGSTKPERAESKKRRKTRHTYVGGAASSELGIQPTWLVPPRFCTGPHGLGWQRLGGHDLLNPTTAASATPSTAC